MERLTIKIVDPIEFKVSKSDSELIRPCLEYQKEYWREGRHKKEKQVYSVAPFRRYKNEIYIFCGFLPRIIQFCKKNRIEIKFKNWSYLHSLPDPITPKLPKIKGFIKFRDNQKLLLRKALKKKRGVIHAATGIGKTITQLGIISAFPDENILILTHTIDIINQTIQKLKDFKFKDVQQIGGGKKANGLHGRIVVSTMQSFRNLDPNEYCDYFDIVMIDEAHHVSSFNGTYAHILERLLAEVRLGFSATMPTKPESIMALEGLLGSIIGKLSVNEAVSQGILAKPKIKLIKTALNDEITYQKTYADVYDTGIVHNDQRNLQILTETFKQVEQGKTVLIMVLKVRHGKILARLATTRFGLDIPFVHGKTNKIDREEIKNKLNKKKVKAAICTVVWKEGVDIPSLNTVINAAGGKDEKGVLQGIGRGLRKTDDKETVLIIDFFDPSHRYLVEHFGHRITLYMEQGWL